MPMQNRVHVPPDALKKLQQERMDHIEGHLSELGKQLSIENQDLDLVVKAQLTLFGVPLTPEGKKDLLDEAIAMASLLSSHKLKKLNLGVKGICKLLNVHDIPDNILWSARRAGVELLDAPAEAGTPEAN